MTPALAMTRPTRIDPLGAGSLLVAVLAVCLAAGALIGLAAGDAGIGLGVGALVGVPAAVAAVIVRYRAT